jgi:hypothetical protein
MPKVNHSLAPWHIDEMQADDWRINISNYYTNIACTYHINLDPVEPDKETMANARLIATAPELLEACKHVMNNLKEMSEENFEHEIAHLEYVINKAEGR